MASYPAPTEELPVFSPSVFETNNIPLTIEEGEKYFITYPTAQGAITIPTLSTGTLGVSGTATIGTAAITTTNVSGTLNITNNSTKATVYGYGTTIPTSGAGEHNSAFGYQAGKTFNTLTTNGGNSAFGALSLFSIADGALNNTAVGHNSLYGLTTGTNNTFVGTAIQTGNLTTNESNNTTLGYNAKCAAGVNTSTAIGSGALASASNQVVLGTSSQTTLIPGTLSNASFIRPTYGTALPVFTSADLGYVLNGTLTASFGAGATWLSQTLETGVWSVLIVANATIASGSFSATEITLAGQTPAAVVHRTFPSTSSATNGYYYYSGIWRQNATSAQTLTVKITTALTGGAFAGSTAYYTIVRIA